MTVKCVHHWYLGPSPDGMINVKCLKCGTEKEYPHIVISQFNEPGKAYYYKDGKAALCIKPQIAQETLL